MKRLLIILAAFFLTMTTNYSAAQVPSDTDARLKKLWETYARASRSDLPADEAAALAEIRKEAMRIDAPWDYYNAALLYRNARIRVDWKSRSAVWEEIENESERYGSAIVIYSLGDAGTSLKNVEALKSARHPQFYSNAGRHGFGAILPDLIRNDYEYCLWKDAVDRESYQRLYDCLGNSYPQNAVAKYSGSMILPVAEKEAALRQLCSEYQGKGIAVLSAVALLEMRYASLDDSDVSNESAFKAIRNEMSDLRKSASSLDGIEKKIANCRDLDELIERLDDKLIQVGVENSKAVVRMSNLSSARLSLVRGDKTVWSARVDAAEKLYHVWTRTEVEIPVVDDGEYKLKCVSTGIDAVRCESEYQRYTLSVASRVDSGGLGVFAADYKSGEPVAEADFTLYGREGKLVASSTRVAFDKGFAALPANLASRLSARKEQYLQLSFTDASGHLRLSPRKALYASEGRVEDESGESYLRCLVLTDRGAYNPGDTVQYKVIAFKGLYEFEPLPQGTGVDVSLYDTEGSCQASASLTTNGFSSAAGSFILPKGRRGGSWHISAGIKGREIESRFIIVDDFVLPNFAVEWDEPGRFFLPEDEICIKGRVFSYSGHNMSELAVSCEISGMESRVAPVGIGQDGRFEIRFPADGRPWSFYRIELMVTDSTGETHSFQTSAYSSAHPYIGLSLMNPSAGRFESGTSRGSLLGSDTAVFDITTDGHPTLSMSYRLLRSGILVDEGDTVPGKLSIDLKGQPSSMYEMHLYCKAVSDCGKEYRDSSKVSFLKVSDTDDRLDCDVVSLFKETSGDGLSVQMGSTSGRTWVFAELFGSGNVLLERKMVVLSGQKSVPGSIANVIFDRKPDYPDNLSLHLLFFKDGRHFSYVREFSFVNEKYRLPLSFTRFLDTTRPSAQCSFELQTEPGVECVAAVYDISTESIMGNRWNALVAGTRPYEPVWYSYNDGFVRAGLYAFGMSANSPRMMKAAVAYDMAVEEESSDMAVMNNSFMAAGSVRDEQSLDDAGQHVRENFAKTLAWLPFLRSDADGLVRFDFNAADKLSTYRVQVFAHDRSMNNAVVSRDLMVTVPVKVAVVQPRFMYTSDVWSLAVSLSSNMAQTTEGSVRLTLYDGEYKSGRVVAEYSSPVCIPSNGSISCSFDDISPVCAGQLGILVSFVPDSPSAASDAVFVSVPVLKASQTITEAHSALLKSGEDRAALESGLRSLFTNMDASEAAVSEISIRGMLSEALPREIQPGSDNAISLSEALYSADLVKALRGSVSADMEKMTGKLRACINEDGGIAWFEGMYSSPVVTALILERCTASESLRNAIGTDAVEKAVRYLDENYFSGKTHPFWCGGISFEQYLHVRAAYSEYAFAASGKDAARLSEFRKQVKSYLIPKGSRGLEGNILSKARRLQILRNLVSSDSGNALAKSWGMRPFAGRRISKSVSADVASLAQYAVEHRSGGVYFPNAVMPWRGLLESELYAHVLLCSLFSDDPATSCISDGIRLWIMVQKETQKWASDPAYIEALAAVFHGSEDLLDTRVLVLSASCDMPFESVKESSNGIAVKRRFMKDGVEIADGMAVRVGDRITAEYVISNEENRSFVKLSAWRPASLRPVDQISGHYGFWVRNFRQPGYGIPVPQGYRSVKSACTEYWFDSFAEGDTVISEDFFVTQEGRFQSPAVEIESLYAPHYRACDNGRGAFESRK